VDQWLEERREVLFMDFSASLCTIKKVVVGKSKPMVMALPLG